MVDVTTKTSDVINDLYEIAKKDIELLEKMQNMTEEEKKAYIEQLKKEVEKENNSIRK